MYLWLKWLLVVLMVSLSAQASGRSFPVRCRELFDKGPHFARAVSIAYAFSSEAQKSVLALVAKPTHVRNFGNLSKEIAKAGGSVSPAAAERAYIAVDDAVAHLEIALEDAKRVSGVLMQALLSTSDYNFWKRVILNAEHPQSPGVYDLDAPGAPFSALARISEATFFITSFQRLEGGWVRSLSDRLETLAKNQVVRVPRLSDLDLARKILRVLTSSSSSSEMRNEAKAIEEERDYDMAAIPAESRYLATLHWLDQIFYAKLSGSLE